jgi:hypothetical protein
VIQRADPHIGLLHRATEKLAETRTFLQTVPYMDRLDYVSMMSNEHAYVMAIEKLLEVDVPLRAQYIRVLFDEITRILNHLMWIGSHALDVGAMTVFLYAFREREDLMDMYEAVSGARLHAAYYRPGGVYRDLPDKMPQYALSTVRSEDKVKELNANRQGSFLDFVEDFTNRFPGYVDDYETLLTDNRIWKQRLVSVGVVTPERAQSLGFTGPMLRGSGHCVGPAQEAALRGLRQAGFRHPHRHQRRLLRPLPGARRGDAPVGPHHEAVHRMAAQESRPRHHVQPQGGAAFAHGDEGEHGRAHPSLQALQRRDARAKGRGVRSRRASKGRVRDLSHVRRARTSRGA